MYDLKSVKKKKTRKIIAGATGICAAALVIICAIAFLGNYSGAFTVSLTHGSENRVGLVNSPESEDYQIYMTVPNVGTYDEFTFTNFYNGEQGVYFNNKDDMDSRIDHESTNYSSTTSESNTSTVKYFKHTFYVVNYGEKKVDYNLTLKLSSNNKAKNGLHSILRVGFYENKLVSDESLPQTHDCKFYALATYEPELIGSEGTDTPQYESRERLYAGSDMFCEKFNSYSELLDSRVEDLEGGEKMRYTFLFWLEGSDPDCKGKAPLDNHLKLSVSINVD